MQNGQANWSGAILIGSICKKQWFVYICFYNYFLFSTNLQIWCFVLMCLFRLLLWLEEYWQIVHENGFVPVCVRICFSISLFDLVNFAQNGQVNWAILNGSICKKHWFVYIEGKIMGLFYDFQTNFFLQIMFCPHVPCKIITLITSIWANCALKRFFSSMCTNMSLHYTFRFGKLCTNWTSK